MGRDGGFRASCVNRRAFLRRLAFSVGSIPLLSTRGGASDPPGPRVQLAQAPARAGGPVTIKFLSWYWAEKGRNDAWRALVKKFHDSQKDIRIEEVGFPYSDYFQRVMTQLAGGRLDADVITYYDEIGLRLLKNSQLEPVDDVVVKLGIRDKLYRPLHDLMTSGGKLYGILILGVPHSIIYNKELYEKAGVMKPPTTQEEYFAVAKQLTRRPNQFGHAGRNTMAEQTGFWQDLTHWVLGYGGVWSKAKKPLVTEPAVINAVKAYKKLYDEAMPQGSTASDYRRMAWEGKVAQYIDNHGNVGMIRAGNPNILPRMFSAPPPWENRKSVNQANFLGVYAGSPHKDAAKAWLEFVYQKENYQLLAEAALDIFPPYDGAMREAYLKGLHWVSGFLATNGVPMAMTMEGFEANMAEFRQTVLRKVSEVLTAGKAPEQAMSEAQKALEELAARI